MAVAAQGVLWRHGPLSILGNRFVLLMSQIDVTSYLHSEVHAAGLVLTAEDMYWANLAGSLEAVDAGTTTTLDHAHMNWSKEHSMFNTLP